MYFDHTRFAWKLWELVVKGLVVSMPLVLLIVLLALPDVLLVPVSTVVAGLLAGVRPAKVVAR